MDVIEIRKISAFETQAVRWPVLRAGMPPESAFFAGDDAPETRHFGAFQGPNLVGVASIYRAEYPSAPALANPWQLRGMAVLPDLRKHGFGQRMLEACIEEARLSGGEWIWCNARSGAVPFYARNGWETAGAEFEIPTAGPHFRMLRRL